MPKRRSGHLWGLTDGRQGIRSGLLERSGLGVALEGRWAEAAAPEPSAKRAVMFATAAACSSAVSGGQWAEAAAPELLTLLLAVVPGCRWAEAAAPEISTLLFAFVLGVAVSKGGGLATLGGRDVGGNILAVVLRATPLVWATLSLALSHVRLALAALRPLLPDPRRRRLQAWS